MYFLSMIYTFSTCSHLADHLLALQLLYVLKIEH